MSIRFKFIGLLLIFLVPIIGKAQNNYSTRIEHFRDSVNKHFKTDGDSPLDSINRISFTMLSYFEVDTTYRVPFKFEKKKRGKRFLMMTTTNRLPEYKVYGTLHFEMEGQKLQLTLYQNAALSKLDTYKDYLFCPFKDLTNGIDTYGGGRYLDFRMGDLEKGMIDFNLCYNPYCAYNHRYSCPIPPKENHLSIRINAGVKSFEDMDH